MPATSSDRSAPFTARRLPTASHLRLPVLQSGGHGGNGLRRIGHGRHHLLDHVRLEVLERKEAAQHDAHSDQHDDHALDHVRLRQGCFALSATSGDIGAMPPAAAERLEQRRRVGVAVGLGLHEADARLLPRAAARSAA